ncbi:hypothetical protein DEDE109153_10485 [Deinococcus deserti]
MVVDVRGLGNFQRAQSSFVMSGGAQVWPDPELIKGVSSDLVMEGNLHTYVTSEAGLAPFKNVTRVKASRVLPSKFAPNSDYLADVELSAAAAREFRSAGEACRVVYFKD